jgi:hypothetical protein
LCDSWLSIAGPVFLLLGLIFELLFARRVRGGEYVEHVKHGGAYVDESAEFLSLVGKNNIDHT